MKQWRKFFVKSIALALFLGMLTGCAFEKTKMEKEC